MAATVEWHCFTGAVPTDDGVIGLGLDLCSADNDAYSAANRTANPVILSEYSYEKWMDLKITAAPDNWISTFRIWGDGTIAANTTLRAGSILAGAQPVDTVSIVAVNDFNAMVVLSKWTFDATVYTLINSWTKFLVFQLYAGAAAAPGDWGPYTVYYDYTEA